GPNAATAKVECGGRSRGSARRPTGDSVSVVIVSLLERLRRRSRPKTAIAVEMLKKAALDFVGEPVTGIAETKVPGDPGDVALGRALARALDGIDNAAQKAAPRRGGLAARTLRQLAGHAEISIKRNAIHGWVPSLLLLRYSHPYNHFIANLVLVDIRYKGYVLIQ